MENGYSRGGNSTLYPSVTRQLWAHHCWEPYCQHETHPCPEEEDEDQEDHKLESPTEFFTKRHIESDGSNVAYLEKELALIDEALGLARRAGSDIFHVAQLQYFCR